MWHRIGGASTSFVGAATTGAGFWVAACVNREQWSGWMGALECRHGGCDVHVRGLCGVQVCTQSDLPQVFCGCCQLLDQGVHLRQRLLGLQVEPCLACLLGTLLRRLRRLAMQLGQA